VLGAGAWGTALAISFSANHAVCLWGRDAAQIGETASARENRRYLPGLQLPREIVLSADLQTALGGADLVLVVVPTKALRATVASAGAIARDVPLVWACKGFEQGTSCLPHQVVIQTLGENAACGAVSGPSFAEEVAAGKPAALTLASRDAALADCLAKLLHSPRLRVYSNTDLIGVELGGAVKNVMAIAVGISDGLGLGHNARAALITRGLAEMARLGMAMGGKAETFMGLTGLGDLVLTCTGDLSRNRRVGLALARGDSIDTILAQLGHVAEGVNTAPEVARMAQRLAIEMPITAAVCAVIAGRLAPIEAVEALMSRDAKAE